MKQYKKEQQEVADMKDFIARFGSSCRVLSLTLSSLILIILLGHGTKKLARMGKSMEKRLAHRLEAGLTEAVTADRITTFRFFECGELAPPVLAFNDVAFGYDPSKPLYSHLDVRHCLVHSFYKPFDI